jgi:hypothetical protein
MLPATLIRVLSGDDLKLYAFLDLKQGATGWPARGYRYVGREIGWQDRTVKKHALVLAELGLIELDADGRRQVVMRVVDNRGRGRVNPGSAIAVGARPEQRARLAPQPPPDPSRVGRTSGGAQGARRDEKPLALDTRVGQGLTGLDRYEACRSCGEEAVSISTSGYFFCEGCAPFDRTIRLDEFGGGRHDESDLIAAAGWQPNHPSDPFDLDAEPMDPAEWDRTLDGLEPRRDRKQVA